MPFLQVNGYTIPVASVRRKDLLLGGRSRAYDGTPQTQDRGRKQIFECKTSPLAEQARKAIIGIIRGDGFVWPWDSDLYSHKGVGPATGKDQATQLDYLAGDGAPVANMAYLTSTLVPYTPHRNGLLSVDPDSTNLLAADQRDAEGVAAGSYTAINGATLSMDTDHYWQGAQSLKVVTDAVGADIEGVETNLINPGGVGTSGNTYVGSVYIKNGTGSAKSVTIYLRDTDNGASGTAHTHISIADGEWIRVACSITLAADSTQLVLRIVESFADSAMTIYCDGFQIEEQAYPTAWVDGARGGADDLRYDIDFNYRFVDWSIGAWFWGPAVARHPALDSVIWQIGLTSTSTPYARLWRRSAALDLIRLTIFDGTTTVNMDTDASDVDWEAWNFIGVSYRTDPETGETRLVVRRINGSDSETYTDNTSLAFPLDAIDRLLVGRTTGPASHWHGHLGELIVLPFAVPVGVWDGIASTMGRAGDGTAAALPLPQWPRKLVTGDALVAHAIGANARDYGTLFEGDVGSIDVLYGDGRNNLGAVAFTLDEV